MVKNKPSRHHPQVQRRRWAIQGGLLLGLITLGLYFGFNLSQNLLRLNIPFGLTFLGNQAGFNIGDTPVAYAPTDPYGRALWVGLLNTLRVVGAGLILTTLLGVVMGIARLSENWLVRQLALVYVETLRNTPLLLQLLFWYFAVFLGLPEFTDRLQWPGPIWLSNQGVVLPWVTPTAATGVWLLLTGLGLGVALALMRRLAHLRREQGRSAVGPWQGAGAVMLLTGAVAAGLTRQGPFTLSLPTVGSTGQVMGGLTLSSEFATLLLGLTLYTAAFIAEIVRAGIMAVPQGQWEAARSLGLGKGQTLRLVVFPQALRVMVPPLTSQYLNLAKNSSLAIATGYPDLYSISSTTFNQTGRAIEVLLLLMVAYLTLSLLLSWVMNQYNRRIQLVER